MATPPTTGAGGAELSQDFLLAGKHFETIYKECSDTEKLKMLVYFIEIPDCNVCVYYV